jgi:hypothetical protein
VLSFKESFIRFFQCRALVAVRNSTGWTDRLTARTSGLSDDCMIIGARAMQLEPELQYKRSGYSSSK